MKKYFSRTVLHLRDERQSPCGIVDMVRGGYLCDFLAIVSSSTLFLPAVQHLNVWSSISRAILLEGFKHFQLEDYLMILTFVCKTSLLAYFQWILRWADSPPDQGFYTNLTVWINIQTQHPHTNILPDTGLAGLSPADIQDRIYGSKITFVVEQSMVLVQWGCKACLILLYYRMT